MDAKAILDGLLDRTQRATQAGMNMAEERSLIPPAGNERNAMLKGVGTGALAAGAIALLFGSKGTRKFAGKAAKLGGTAAIGGLAYKAYTEWQAQQAAQGGAGNTGRPDVSTAGTGASAQPFSGTLDLDQFEQMGTPVSDLVDDEATARCESIIQAMISAARADGHVDDDEMALITRQIASFELERDVTSFLLSELNKPVSVDAIAALADTPETAAELYIASALVVDMESQAERAYLDELAAAMQIDPGLIPHLEAPLKE
ncbi:tellurite resistance TerB family protein [Granulosicoccus sp. 3-233]|uniref:tellurite resistance TerB family protein n=1 Tax=Granulosicoccus sp. 3-233 TaxID=3417969 RepID=UPI003D350BF5